MLELWPARFLSHRAFWRTAVCRTADLAPIASLVAGGALLASFAPFARAFETYRTTSTEIPARSWDTLDGRPVVVLGLGVAGRVRLFDLVLRYRPAGRIRYLCRRPEHASGSGRSGRDDHCRWIGRHIVPSGAGWECEPCRPAVICYCFHQVGQVKHRSTQSSGLLPKPVCCDAHGEATNRVCLRQRCQPWQRLASMMTRSQEAQTG